MSWAWRLNRREESGANGDQARYDGVWQGWHSAFPFESMNSARDLLSRRPSRLPADSTQPKPSRRDSVGENAKMWMRGTRFYLLTACATIELLMFGWLCSLGQEA